MAPKPIEGVDFPALDHDILQLILALLTLVHDLYDAFWTFVLQILWALWTCVVALWGCVQALWTLFRDICITIWDYTYLAVSSVWTYVFQSFWNEFTGAIVGLVTYASAHPTTSMVMFFLAFVYIPRMLNAIGMEYLDVQDVERSALRDSHGANYQSTSHDGNATIGKDSTQKSNNGCRAGCNCQRA